MENVLIVDQYQNWWILESSNFSNTLQPNKRITPGASTLLRIVPRCRGIQEGAVSWIYWHLDASSVSLNPVSERRSEFRYTVALPRGTQLVNTIFVRKGKGKKHKGRRQEIGKTRHPVRLDGDEDEGEATEGPSEKKRCVNCMKSEGEREREGVNRENGLAATTSAPLALPRSVGDLPSWAKPLINAFAKKLHAVSGKQEQEGVGRARSDTQDLSFFSPSLSLSLLFCFFTLAFTALFSWTERANLRSQFDRDSGPDSTCPRRFRRRVFSP